MTRRSDISQELQEISPGLAHLSLVNPYRVPAGYFESLAEHILLRIKAEDGGTAAEEIERISPLLGSIRKDMPFSVPAGYFEQLSAKIPEAQPEAKPAKVISFKASKVFRYAAAAVTVGVICVFAWLFVKEPVNDNGNLAVAENVTESQVIENIGKLSESEIADFVEGGSIVYSLEAGAAQGEIAGADVQLMLADINDNELEGCLQVNNPEKEKFN